MSARKSALTLPLPLQFLAAWLAVWLGRFLRKSQDVVGSSAVACRERLGGLLKFYYREAA